VDLAFGDSPRLGGVDQDHIRILAELETPLPPIYVHFESMRIIDGVHRVNAARLNGRADIQARFFHGSDEDAFRLGVEANVSHGLPLTVADRRAAAERIIRSRPELSDRAIAAAAGLAAKTVAAIRRRVSDTVVRSARVGLDGRTRPLSTSEGRRRALEIIAARPDATLREIAGEVGVSVGTVRDVRDRVRAGEDPIPAQRHPKPNAGPSSVRPASRAPQETEAADIGPLLEGLCRDPSLRYTDAGKALLRWLLPQAEMLGRWREATNAVPPHCGVMVAKVAAECARRWSEMAKELDRRSECA
jgi:ParB-like chromosome segregation protein Spo0J